MQSKLDRIEKQIQSIKEKLQQIGEMRPGSLTRQYHFLSKDRKYPYYQISYTRDMKSHTGYLRKELVDDTKKQIKNYRIFKSLIKRWVDLAIQHAKIKIDIANKKL